MKAFFSLFACILSLSEAFQIAPWNVRSSGSCGSTLAGPRTFLDRDGRVNRFPMVNPLVESTDSHASSSLLTSDLLGVATDIAFGIVGIFAFLAGLAFLSANWLIPMAAKQLEDNCRKDFPELWSEYEAKLEPGESLVTRPDLIQELGDLYNVRFIERLQAAEAAAAQQKSRASSSATDPVEAPPKASMANAIDAEVVKQVLDNQEGTD
jgi:hypothetical protein